MRTSGYGYDAAGNQVRILRADGSALRFQYDAAVRVVSVTAENQQVVGGYRYGATSARLMSDEGGVRTYYLWSGGAIKGCGNTLRAVYPASW